MKMTNRNYNILFHTHTVSGIVISVLLYVIFFAGSFSFFRDEIVNWERVESMNEGLGIHLDIDAALDSLNNQFSLYGRNVTFSQYYLEKRLNVNLSGSADTLASDDDKASTFFYLNTDTFERHDYWNSYSLGEFLYRLHFFAQIPYPVGYYLSGFTAFFFIFALITGVLIHWDKIISNFYLFRPWTKLKTLWTDAHAALGVIGLPFQFVYAVTGAFFMIKLLFVAPVVAVLYDGNQGQLYKDLEYTQPSFAFENREIEGFSVNDFIAKSQHLWDGFKISKVDIQNYGDANMHVILEGRVDPREKFVSLGHVIYKVSTGEIVSVKSPSEGSSYLDGVKDVLYRLHFGDYGGYALKYVSFVLGIIGCFVILSGVLVWLTARDKNNIPEKRRRFNERVVSIYLAICLSMYLSFIAVKVIESTGPTLIYSFYFIGWLILSVLFILKKDNFFTNKYSLLSGGVIGLLIPIANGVFSGNWFWLTFMRQQYDIFSVDILWIAISIAALFAFSRLKLRNAPALEKAS